VLHEFSRDNSEKFTIKAGAMPNVVMTPEQVAQLARMPSRQELLATLLGTMQGPVAKLARTLNEVPGKFVRTLAALQEQKEKQAA
jgi:large subunit ribosomal protein L10